MRVGDFMLDVDGEAVKINSITEVFFPVTVYNMEVSGQHNYFADGVLVHNKQAALGFADGTNGFQTVPSGFPNDSFPIALSSGEQFAVIPANKGNGQGGGSGMVINLTYAPGLSTASAAELEQNLMPVIRKGIQMTRRGV